MKKKFFDKLLMNIGYKIIRCNKHEIWSNGKQHVAVPTHKEINDMIAKRLLKEINYPVTVSELNYKGLT